MMPSRTSRLSSTTKIEIRFVTAVPLPRDWLSSLRFGVASERRQSEGETDRQRKGVCGSTTSPCNCRESATWRPSHSRQKKRALSSFSLLFSLLSEGEPVIPSAEGARDLLLTRGTRA